MGFKIMPNQTIALSNIKDRQKEDIARQYDVGNKGYLTTQEAYALFADQNRDVQPGSLKDVVEFLGGTQHAMTVHHQGWGEVMSLPWHVHDWAGDFSVPGLGAGNLRVGGLHNWERPDDPMAAVFMFDCNLMDLGRLENEVLSATLVLAPKGFAAEAGAKSAEVVEVPLTLATQAAHRTWTRGGSSHIPEQKFLAAAVDVSDLRDFTGGKDLEFYVRLETTSGTKWINKDGQGGKNFSITDDQLKKYAGIQ